MIKIHVIHVGVASPVTGFGSLGPQPKSTCAATAGTKFRRIGRCDGPGFSLFTKRRIAE